MTYYFAYGSNMDEGQMKERCPDMKVLGMAKLPGYALGFTIYSPKRHCGCADVIKDPSKNVYGLLYNVTVKDIKSLDDYEGIPIYYQRISIKVESESLGLVSAETYEVVHKAADFQKPSKDYLDKLIRAAKKFSFPSEYQDFLKKIIVLPDS